METSLTDVEVDKMPWGGRSSSHSCSHSRPHSCPWFLGLRWPSIGYCKFDAVREACSKTYGLCGSGPAPTPTPAPDPTPAPTPVPGSSICAGEPSQPCKKYKSIGYCKIGAIKEACRTAAASVSELLAA